MLLAHAGTRDGHKNVVAMASGRGPGKVQLTDLAKLEPRPLALRFESVTFSVEAGTKVILQWANGFPLMPLEGRGMLSVEAFEGLKGEEGQDLIAIVEGKGLVFLALDLTKLGV
jgi:hypothetical protein